MSTAQNLLNAKALAETRQARFASRNRVNKIALTLSLAAMAFGVFWLVWILWETLRQGVGGLAIATFTEMTPPLLKESAYGLGSTTWEVVSKVVLPYTKAGVIGGIMLGLGRALGETMAVTFVIGNTNQLNSLSLFEAANSITSVLANEFAEAGAGLHQASLMYLGLVLFFITFVVLTLSKVLLAQMKKSEGTKS